MQRKNLVTSPSHNLYQASHNSPLGKITIVAHDNALVGLWIEGQKYFAQAVRTQVLIPRITPIIAQVKSWLDSYFQGQNPNPHLIPLDPHGTMFQLAVWQVLSAIPYGQVTTYGAIACQVAERLGKSKMSAQAIGGAVGRNPISIIIPCHRVVGATGKLVGYAGGLDKKQYLIKLEGDD